MPLLTTAPRFLSRSACSRRGHYSPLRRKCRRASAGLFSGLRGSLCRGSRRLRASCHAARPPRRATARPSAKNTLRLRRNCFFACGSRCFPAPGRSALLCRGGPCGRPRAGVGTRPYKPVFSPFPYSHPPGWPRLPLQGNLSSVRIGPLGGDKPRPYAASAGRARAKGHAAGYACGVSSSSSVFFVSLW